MGSMKLDDATFQRVAKALSDPHRLHILEMLRADGRLNCRTMVDRLDLAQATVSHHLKELLNAGVLTVTPQGAYNFYAIRPETLDAYTLELRRRFLPETRQ
jgi:ArsR family transcriptional regulator, arsenate/arsenite/antimonite-responsive transcriptional repressor